LTPQRKISTLCSHFLPFSFIYNFATATLLNLIWDHHQAVPLRQLCYYEIYDLHSFNPEKSRLLNSPPKIYDDLHQLNSPKITRCLTEAADTVVAEEDLVMGMQTMVAIHTLEATIPTGIQNTSSLVFLFSAALRDEVCWITLLHSAYQQAHHNRQHARLVISCACFRI
jgi:hypothetical protein